MAQDNMKPLKNIKSSILQRGLSLTRLTIDTGTKVVGHNLSTVFANAESKDLKWQKLLASQAQKLSKELGELKGSLMKAGQVISMYGELFLPPEANEFLKTLQSKSPPLQYSEIERILRQQLGSKLEDLEIDPVAVGSASLGQVHKAKIKSTQQWIALKVQYPGVAQAIESDLKAIRSFLSMLNLLPGELQTEVLFTEVHEMLKQELDYPSELKHTEHYGSLLQDDSRFVVPKVLPEYSAEHVIAESFEKGLAIDDPLVVALSPDRRNKLARAYLELYFKEIFQWRLVQTDPHLGNYKARLHPNGEDQLVLLDFGAVREYAPDFMQTYSRMIKAALLRDKAALEKASLELKFIAESDSPELKQQFQDFCLMTVEPFLDPTDPHAKFMNAEGVYDWKKSDLPKRLTQKVLQIIRGFPLRTPPRELVFLDRKTGGVFVFLSVLGAQIQGRDLILKYLESVPLK
jgi:predicted unusual protein kinase regulating ubiquinone biosynthesis (AarF/ABC1/UbiB family)